MDRAHADGDGDKQHGDGRAGAHRGQGGLAVGGKIAHHHAVHRIIKLLQKMACHQRQGKEQDQPPFAALRHVPFPNLSLGHVLTLSFF